MSLHRTPAFFGAYRFLPHRLLNGAARLCTQSRWPAGLIQAAIRHWIRSQDIDMGDYEEAQYATLEDFFLRRLRPGARPLGEGFVSPVDGHLFQHGPIEAQAILQIKGKPISLSAMVNGRHGCFPVASLEGGTFLTIFLTPNGYHRIHMPCEGRVEQLLWHRGRFFPQNRDAIEHIPRIYERNERAVLVCQGAWPFVMVLVGASLIGGIHLRKAERQEWVREAPYPCQWELAKAEELAHFSFGSTVVLLLPPAWPMAGLPEVGTSLRMGQTLFSHGQSA